MAGSTTHFGLLVRRGREPSLSIRDSACGALLPLEREALRALLQNGTGHLSLAVELELEERPARVLEAGLRPRVEGDLRIRARLHEQRAPSRRKVAVNPDAALYSPT